MGVTKGEKRSTIYELKCFRNVLMDIRKGESNSGNFSSMFDVKIKSFDEVKHSNVMNIRKEYNISYDGYRLIYELLNAILFNNIVSELSQMYIVTDLSIEKITPCYYGYLRSLSEENKLKYNEKGDKSRAISQNRRDVEKVAKVFDGKLNIVEQCLNGTIDPKMINTYIDRLSKLELKESNGMCEYNDRMVIPFKSYPVVNELSQNEFEKFMKILEINSKKAIEIKTKGLNSKFIGYFEYLVTRSEKTGEEEERLNMIRDILGM